MYLTNRLFGPYCLIEVEDGELPPDSHFFSRLQVSNKIQVFASKYGLNNSFEDMNQISKLGLICFSIQKHISSWKSFDRIPLYNFNFTIINRNKNEIGEIRKNDYKIRTAYAHLFFEIPVVANMNEEKILALQKFCFRKLMTQAEYNNKKAQAWLRKKQLLADFEEK